MPVYGRPGADWLGTFRERAPEKDIKDVPAIPKKSKWALDIARRKAKHPKGST